ncbi:TIGR01741 family protein [Staphylococcus epidermidis]|uniref:TIGR01741 family protein n=1 Tax=Staphylococcus epidermidis TaxID=1282 RepID=UPI0018C679C3|nr:TIGR01741 family protein [Staphylococcus epidermidis]MBG3871712.1 TIGR01741 family protein [Staphylococcus epidermidis]MCH9582806.1 TIGR01741 family protein [Staphylococcus epidermidis]WHI81714.1 TIGR01741 family protein [Staphylococcus epidermidis]
MRDIFGIFRKKKKGFEEKLNEMYQEIASKINEMVPVEWERVYTMAYINEESEEVFFNYTTPGSDDLHYYTAIPKDYNVSKKVFDGLLDELYECFEKLQDLFKEVNQEPWTSCEFDFNNEGKLNVSFDYIDWKNSGFGQISRDYYYEYKKFGIIPELDYAKKEIKDIEKFIKEQEKE